MRLSECLWRYKSSGTCCCVNWQIITDLLKEATASTAYPKEWSSKLSSKTTLCVYQLTVSYIKTDKFSCSQLFDALKSLPTLVTFILLVVRILLWKIKFHLLLDFSHTILLKDRNLTPAGTLLTSILKVPSLNLSQDTFYPEWVSIQSSSAYLSKCLWVF